MFAGIVESQGRIVHVARASNVVRITVEKPSDFSDIKIGDSIACSGICLTVESFDDRTMQFALGAETLQVTSWNEEKLKGLSLNLERSLRFGDRIHGHMVSGHVDALASVEEVKDLGGSTLLRIAVSSALTPYLWKKGSWAVNGVSLTINEVEPSVERAIVSVCLIPETLLRTNLATLKKGDLVNIEIDMMARGLLHALRNGELSKLRAEEAAT